MNELIINNLPNSKIINVQLDPNSVCNSKCWFCPVKYYGNPRDKVGNMSPELMEKIFINLLDGRGTIVDENFNGIYTAHYNEIFLYTYLEEMLQLLTKYNLRMMFLSNGITFDEDKLNLLNKYKNAVSGICLNIPAYTFENLNKFTSISKTNYVRLMKNIERFYKSDFVSFSSIQMNGIDSSMINQIDILENCPDLDLDPITGTIHREYEIFKNAFPDINIFKNIGLSDRGETLKSRRILANKKNNDNKTFITCGNNDRLFTWLHINAVGETFTCCNDFFMDYVYGDFKKQKLSEIWRSERQAEVYNNIINNLCKKCTCATFN